MTRCPVRALSNRHAARDGSTTVKDGRLSPNNTEKGPATAAAGPPTPDWAKTWVGGSGNCRSASVRSAVYPCITRSGYTRSSATTCRHRDPAVLCGNSGCFGNGVIVVAADADHLRAMSDDCCATLIADARVNEYSAVRPPLAERRALRTCHDGRPLAQDTVIPRATAFTSGA